MRKFYTFVSQHFPSERQRRNSNQGNKGNAASGGNRKCALRFIEKVPTLVPDGSVSMQIRNPNSHSLIGPNSTVLIGWLCTFWLVVMELLSLVSTDARDDIAAQFWLDGAGPRQSQELPYKRWLRQEQVQEAGSSACGSSLRWRVCGRPLSVMAASLWLRIWALLTTRSPSWQMYSFSGSTHSILTLLLCLIWSKFYGISCWQLAAEKSLEKGLRYESSNNSELGTTRLRWIWVNWWFNW